MRNSPYFILLLVFAFFVGTVLVVNVVAFVWGKILDRTIKRLEASSQERAMQSEEGVRP